MKKILFALILISAIGACKSKKEAQKAQAELQKKAAIEPAERAENSIDWSGSYAGIVPCADCEGIKTELLLRADGSYRYKSEYMGKLDQPFIEEGKFEWDLQNPSILSLMADISNPTHYLVQENSLLQLGKNKEIVQSPLAEKYRLYKKIEQNSPLVGSKWELTEIYGEPVETAEGAKTPVLEFNSSSEISGQGGCNSFFGSYRQEKMRLIRFSQIGMTEMECFFKSYDSEILRAMEEADNFNLIEENELRLSTGKRASHAIFKRVRVD